MPQGFVQSLQAGGLAVVVMAGLLVAGCARPQPPEDTQESQTRANVQTPEQDQGQTQEQTASPSHEQETPVQQLDHQPESTPWTDDEQTIEIPETWKRLGQNQIWVDFTEKKVIIAGTICLNAGALEMFACPERTKEHESIVATRAQAQEMHAALLAVGATPGAPCSWDDFSFTSPSGSTIDIELIWHDEEINQIRKRSAKEMLKLRPPYDPRFYLYRDYYFPGRHQRTLEKIRTQRYPNIKWVFGGSRFFEDPETKNRYYAANSGEMICVSNFSTAAIDLSIVSSQENSSLLFYANPKTTPPRGTRVYMVLKPGPFLEPKQIKYPDLETK